MTKGIYGRDGYIVIVDNTITQEQEGLYAERYAGYGVNLVSWTPDFDGVGYGQITLELTTYQSADKSGWTSDVKWMVVSPAEKIGNKAYKYTITLDPTVEDVKNTGNLYWEGDDREWFAPLNKPSVVDAELFNVEEKPVLVVYDGRKKSSIKVNGVDYKLFAMPTHEWEQSNYGRHITFIPKSDVYEISSFSVEQLGEYVISIQ